MPKDTFNNLDEMKKHAIFDAAVKEFSVSRFSEASINQIVRYAGIPRGSFYQYFSGKEDVYLYVYGEIAKEQQAVAARIEPPGPDAGVFDSFLYKTRVTLELGKEKPEYMRIAMLMEKDDSAFIARLRTLSSEDKQRVLDLFERDKQRGRIKPDVDSKLVIDMLYKLSVKEFFQEGLDEDLFYKRISGIIKVIREGISTDKD